MSWRMIIFITLMTILVLSMALQIQVVFDVAFWILFNIFAGMDIILGGWFFLPAFVSWTLVGFVLGFLFYFGLRQSYRLQSTAYRTLALRCAWGFLGITCILGVISAWRASGSIFPAARPPVGPPAQQQRPAQPDAARQNSGIIGRVDWQKFFPHRENLILNGITAVSEGKYALVGMVKPPIYSFMLDSTGKMVWEQAYTGATSYQGRAIMRLPKGGFLIVGSAYPQDNSNEDGFAVRLNSAGQLVWIRSWGGKSRDGFNSLCLDPKKGFILAGYSDTVEGLNRGWLLAIDDWGNSLGEQYFTRGHSRFNSVAATPEGGLILGGTGVSPNNLEGEMRVLMGAQFSDQGWVLKLSSEWNTQNEVFLGPMNGSAVQQIIPCRQGGYACIGLTDNQRNSFFAKLDKTGSVQNVQFYDSTGDLGGYGITELMDGRFLAVGITSQLGDSRGDGWLASLDSTGLILRQQAFNPGGRDRFYAIQPLSENEFVLAGSRTVPESGRLEGWVLKLTLTDKTDNP